MPSTSWGIPSGVALQAERKVAVQPPSLQHSRKRINAVRDAILGYGQQNLSEYRATFGMPPCDKRARALVDRGA